ncbi:MAG: hypothetical protein P9L99_00015 [Candidatus Lernaella stagnicola]|nr:hypothetical protein [Candidatus Lernaella stagnicola]
MRTKIVIFSVLLCVVMVSISAKAQDATLGQAASKFEIAQLEDVTDRLREDASALGLSISEAEMKEIRYWVRLETSEGTVRRAQPSGHMIFVAKNVARPELEKDGISLSDSEIREKAVSLAVSLGVNGEEVGEVFVRKIMTQLEDAEGNDVGLPKVAGFAVSCKRHLGDLEVFGGGAKFFFNAHGELWRADIKWRPITEDSGTTVVLTGYDEAEEKLKSVIRERCGEREPHSENFFMVYNEAESREGQDNYTPVLIGQYSVIENGLIETVSVTLD